MFINIVLTLILIAIYIISPFFGFIGIILFSIQFLVQFSFRKVLITNLNTFKSPDNSFDEAQKQTILSNSKTAAEYWKKFSVFVCFLSCFVLLSIWILFILNALPFLAFSDNDRIWSMVINIILISLNVFYYFCVVKNIQKIREDFSI